MSKLKLTEEEVKHLAHLARLGLTESEISLFSQQLAEVITYNIELLSELDVTNVEATAQTTGLKNVWQADEPAVSLPVEDVLDQAPKRRDNYFAVPAVMGES